MRSCAPACCCPPDELTVAVAVDDEIHGCQAAAIDERLFGVGYRKVEMAVEIGWRHRCPCARLGPTGYGRMIGSRWLLSARSMRSHRCFNRTVPYLGRLRSPAVPALNPPLNRFLSGGRSVSSLLLEVARRLGDDLIRSHGFSGGFVRCRGRRRRHRLAWPPDRSPNRLNDGVIVAGRKSRLPCCCYRRLLP